MTKLSNLNSAAVLNATDLIYVVQNGVSLKATVAQISVGAILTAGRVPFMGGLGVLTDSANLTFAGSTLNVPTVNASTSVVTPLLQSSGLLGFGANGAAAQWQIDSSIFSFAPVGAQDNLLNIGGASNRIKTLFTPIIDSGTTGSLSLRTNNGATQLQILHAASAVNNLAIAGSASGVATAQITTVGSDANVQLAFITQGTGSYTFDTSSGGNRQLTILHTASTNRNITITGSNGGNPVIDVTAGALKLSGGTSDIQWGKANVALGGGAAPTVGTIGGTGPAAAAQRNWLRFLESDGTASFIPVWR